MSQVLLCLGVKSLAKSKLRTFSHTQKHQTSLTLAIFDPKAQKLTSSVLNLGHF